MHFVIGNFTKNFSCLSLIAAEKITFLFYITDWQIDKVFYRVASLLKGFSTIVNDPPCFFYSLRRTYVIYLILSLSMCLNQYWDVHTLQLNKANFVHPPRKTTTSIINKVCTMPLEYTPRGFVDFFLQCRPVLTNMKMFLYWIIPITKLFWKMKLKGNGKLL